MTEFFTPRVCVCVCVFFNRNLWMDQHEHDEDNPFFARITSDE